MSLFSKIELPGGDKYGVRAGAIPFGRVDSTSTATAFTATVLGVTELVDGTCVMLDNGVITSASGFTLNVNGLGAKPVYTNLAAATRDTTIFNVAYTMLFVYDEERVSGGCWVCYRGYDSNTNTIGYQLRTNSTTLTASDKGYRYRLWFTSADGTKRVPANISTATDSTTARTLNTRPINPFGSIIYYSTNGTTNAGAKLSATTQWEQYTLTIGYTYVITLADNKPVYVQCTPQSDGSAVMNTITQTLPSTEDGKIYIFLGFAYTTTSIELRPNHPIYYYKDGAIRLWTNTAVPEVVDTYSSTGTDAISGKGVSAALGTLDSSIAATTGQAISAITISNGKITGSTKISVGDANQNAFSNIKIGNSTIAADTTTDTVELVAGGLVSLTADTTNDKVTISASYTVSAADVTSALGFTPASTNVASSTANGLMSSSDKSKLDGLSPTGQVQADWDVSDSTSAAFIKNKPTIPEDRLFVVTVTLTSTTAGTSNKSASEIATAAAAGKLPVVVTSLGNTSMVASLSHIDYDSDFGVYTAYFTYEDQSNLFYQYGTMQIHENKGVTINFINGYVPSGGNISNFNNDAGYLTQTTLGAALQANTAIIYEITYTEPTFLTSGIYAIADTLANVVANISSDRKVIFRQSLSTGKYNYWQPWFNNPNSDKIGLYRFEKDGGKLYHVVFEPDSGGTGLTGTEVGPYYLNQYDPYAVGKVIITSSRSDDPNNYLSGSWTLIDKEFAGYSRHEISGISANTTNTNSVSLVASRMGHDVYLQATINNKVAIGTANLELFTMPSISILGLTDRIDVSYFYFLGYCDNANAAAMMDIDYSGRVRSLNVLTRGNATSIAAGNVITATFTLHNPPHNMADSFCDKFYWQRYS